jgi:hypothetical protein
MGTPFDSKLFYLWGHTYEFAQENNWQVIRDFCSKMAGRKDIWYATNSEIFEYVEAWRKLISSGDGQKLYNPTATVLWFEDAKGVRSIAPGETLCVH